MNVCKKQTRKLLVKLNFAKQVKKEQRQVNKKFCELKKRKYRDC